MVLLKLSLSNGEDMEGLNPDKITFRNTHFIGGHHVSGLNPMDVKRPSDSAVHAGLPVADVDIVDEAVQDPRAHTGTASGPVARPAIASLQAAVRFQKYAGWLVPFDETTALYPRRRKCFPTTEPGVNDAQQGMLRNASNSSESAF